MNIQYRWVLFVILAALGASCAAPARPSDDAVFEFSSGGAYHVEGYGAWQTSLDAGGTFTAVHDVRGEVEEFGPYELTEAQNDELWALIHATGLQDLSSSERLGLPDEVQYTFSLIEKGQVHEAALWAGDAREHEALMTLIEYIAALIEEQTRQTAVLR
ncbi:MAG: hypothetical protein ACE5E7_07685 [Anaerolineae bacterium]